MGHLLYHTGSKILRSGTKFRTLRVLAGLCTLALLVASGCRHDHLPSPSTGGTDYSQTNLVTDTSGLDGGRTDAWLKNPWGIAISPKGSFWIACNHSGSSVIYDAKGAQMIAPVALPSSGIHFGGSPTGVVYNGGADFTVGGKVARFIYATEDGHLEAWASGDSTVTVADRSYVNAIYKGIAIATDGGASYIYAADFHNGVVDVFDANFQYLAYHMLTDPELPAGFAPFNIRNINGKLFVTYARQKAPENEEDQPGPGNGLVNVFAPNGTLIRRFASDAPLNSPWGIINVPPGFGQKPGTILVANFGDGRINVFDSTGVFAGPLENNGIPIIINGLWDIAFYSSINNQLFFTAAPDEESHGIFGYLAPK